MDSNILECGICRNLFSETYSPRILPCSHTFCSFCIDSIISDRKITCCLCSEQFIASSAANFTLNRSLLDVAKQLSSEDEKSKTKGPSRFFLEFIQGFREKIIKEAIVDSQGKELYLQAFIKRLTGKRDLVLGVNNEFEDLIEMLQKMKVSNDETLDVIGKRLHWWTDKSHMIEQDGKKIRDLLAKLDSTKDFTSGSPLIDEIENLYDDIRGKMEGIQKCDMELPEEKDDFVKEILKSKIWLTGIKREINGQVDENSPVKITVDELRIFCGSLRKIVRGEIFVVYTEEGTQRTAPIKIMSENQVCFSHLEERDLPPKSLGFELESLWRKTSRRVFLDLAVEGTSLGRVVIALGDQKIQTFLAYHFLIMCADCRSFYGRFKVVRIWKEEANESLVLTMGNKGTEDDASWKSVLPGVNRRMEEKNNLDEVSEFMEGGVISWFSPEIDDIVFFICAAGDPRISKSFYFGDVEEGLDIVKDAISSYSDNAKVDVIDCGLMLSF